MLKTYFKIQFVSTLIILFNLDCAVGANKKSTLKFVETHETVTTTKTLRRVDQSTGTGNVEQLAIQLELSSTKFKNCGDIVIWVSMTNKFPEAIILDSTILGYPSLVLEFRKSGATETFKIGPTSHNKNQAPKILRLESQQKWEASYGGNTFCSATSLAAGRYEVRFLYQSSNSNNSQWSGELSSSWIPFEIQPNHLIQK